MRRETGFGTQQDICAKRANAMKRRTFLTAATAALLTPAAPALGQISGDEVFSAAARYSAEHGGVAFLVVRNGVVLAEAYADGVREAERWPIGAGTKILAPLLAASMVRDRALNLNEPVAMTFGEWGADPVKQLITVRQLLCGTSGLGFAPGAPTTLEGAMALQPQAAPGTRFIDSAAPYLLFAEIARRKLVTAGRGQDPARYLTERTLSAIGALPIGWTRDSSGAARFDNGAHLSARSWALVGELIRREGFWRATTLVDRDTLRAARASEAPEPRAGMGLWISAHSGGSGDLSVDSDLWQMRPQAPEDLVMAAGEGAQRLYLVPSEQLVAVRLSRGEPSPSWSDARFLALLSSEL